MKLKQLSFMIVGFVLIALVNLFVDISAMGITLAIAVVGGQYSPSMQVFRINLEKKVGKEVWWKGRLSQLTAFIDYEKFKTTGVVGSVKNSSALEASIIHMVRDFVSKKGIKIDIPLRRPLTGQGRIGTAPLSGTGEKRKMFYLKCAINMRRHAVQTRDNEMSEQVLDEAIAMDMLESGATDLKDWFSRLMPFEFLKAIFVGYSENLYDSSWGLGYSMKSHPNFFVQAYTGGLNGGGQIPFKSADGTHVAYTFDSGYEVNCATGLATLTDTSACYFSTQSIRNIVFLASKNKIQFIKKGAYEVLPILVTSAHIRQLRLDEDWKNAMYYAYGTGKDNPIFTGAMETYIYENAMLIVDDTLPSAFLTGDSEFSTTYSTNGLSTGIQYGRGSDYMETPRDGGSRKAAVALGVGAIIAAEGKGFLLTQETADHGQKIEDGGRMIYGAQRADIIDDDNQLGNGANLFYDNQSSLVYWTFSPDSFAI
jgi:hypothetical protein